MKQNGYAKYVYVILWVFWMMFCVRYGFVFGLLGTGSQTSAVSSVVFAGVFCPLIPLTLLFIKKERCVWLVRIAVLLAAAGIVTVLLPGRAYFFAASALLAAGSALLTAVLLYLYNFTMDRRGQVIAITLFLAVKPVVSAGAVFLSDHVPAFWLPLAAGAVAAGIFVVSLFLRGEDFSQEHIEPGTAGPRGLSVFLVFVFYALFIF
jgi:hypothetical protein